MRYFQRCRFRRSLRRHRRGRGTESSLYLTAYIDNLLELAMFAPNRRPGQYRRVVSGFNAEGKSVIAEDKIIDSKPMHDGRDFLSTVWTTAESPANVLEEGDGALRELPGLGITSPGGVLLRYHELQADGGPGFHSNRCLHIDLSFSYTVGGFWDYP